MAINLISHVDIKLGQAKLMQWFEIFSFKSKWYGWESYVTEVLVWRSITQAERLGGFLVLLEKDEAHEWAEED